MSEVNPDMTAQLYEDQSYLMEDMMETAFADASMSDVDMIANIIAGSGSDEMAAAMFENISYTDPTLMTEVFVDVATQSPETIVAVAAADTAVYQAVVQESFSTGGMTAAALVQDITSDLGYAPGQAPVSSGISYDSDWDMRSLTYETAMAAGYTPGMSSLIADPYDSPCLLYTSPSPRD